MDFLDKDELFDIFLVEAQDTLQELSSFLLELEKNREDEESIKNIFRSAHTLKGNSATVYNTFSDGENDDFRLKNTKKLSEVTHILENLITEARDNGMKFTPEHIDVLFEAEQVLENILGLIESKSEIEMNVSDIILKLQQAVDNYTLSDVETTDNSTSNDSTEEEIGFTFKLDTILEDDFRFASLSLIHQSIEDKYPNAKFNPSKKDVEDGKSFDNVFVTIETTDSVDTIISFIEELAFVSKVHFVEHENKTEEPSSLHIDNQPSPENIPLPEISENQPQNLLDSQANLSNNQTKNAFLRVPVNRIDKVLKHVSSLVILRNKLMNFTKKIDNKGLLDVAGEIFQSIDYLQDSVMNIRMTPLEQLFIRFPKDVRNLAKQANKKVKYVYVGKDTEIDKSLLDEISKPLTHLIKNSIAHGLETEEERIAAGKNPEGLLRLSAKHEQSMVVLTVEDDGRGINVESVKQKAIEKGLISSEKAEKASREEIINFIFHPGLSTSDTVNKISGRGVGMDAVRAVVEEMKGHIEVKSVDGQGTTTIINLPLTLAIIPALLTKIEDKHFSIPTSQVIEAIEVHPSDIRHVANQEVYVFRDQEIPILRLKEFFNINHERNNAEKLKIVVLKSGNKTLGATVDEWIELEDIVVKNIGEYLGSIPGISGCNILGDGAISLIVDVNTITNSVKITE